MADNSSILSALKGVDPAEAMPFGAGATPEGSPTALSSMISGLFGMPQKLIENSQQSLNTGNYDPKLPMEAAMSLAGAGAPAAEAGAAGIFGGKLAKTANMEKLAQAERMEGKLQNPEMVRQLTGWFRGPDNQWRFEIPDERSRMLMPDAGGPAHALFQHPELYKAYPSLKHVQMYSETNPNFAGDIGLWNLENNMMELSSRNPKEARLGALHEMQHAVQHIEGFTPGTTVEAYEQLFKEHPDMVAKLAPEQKPFDLYNRTAGEVEARNVERRADFNPKARYDIAPHETQDVPHNQQLRVPAIAEDHPILRILRGQ